MDTTKALILGGAIAIGGVAVYKAMDEPSTGEQIGESIDEGVEEFRDEVDDAS